MSRHRRMWQTGALSTLVAILVTSILAGPVAADSYPGALVAWYMNTIDTTTLYNMGCSVGTARANGSAPQDGLVILDYGLPKKSGSTYGASAFGGNGGFASTTQIRNAAVEFAHGFWVCTGANTSAHVTIALGTSNNSQVGGLANADITAHGQAWATMVNSINSDLVSHGYSSQASAAGADDIEVSWSTYARAKLWVDGYNGSHQYPMYDYGDAAGCPSSGATSAPAPCGSWNQDNLYYVSWGSPAAFAEPEIYREDGIQASQWQQISKYATLAGKSRIGFSGSLTQHGACAGGGCSGTNNTAAAGWQQLHDRVDSDAATSITALRFAADIRWH
ncbi:MAG: hypothetical protein ACOYXS_05860 [Chloroflexota bacterium]